MSGDPPEGMMAKSGSDPDISGGWDAEPGPAVPSTPSTPPPEPAPKRTVPRPKASVSIGPPAPSSAKEAVKEAGPTSVEPVTEPSPTAPAAPTAQSDIPPPPDLPAIDAVIAAEEAAPTERRPSFPGGDPSEGPPDIQRFLSPASAPLGPPPSNPVPDSGSARRRSRRTVKIPDDAVPQKAETQPAPPAETPKPPPVAVEPAPAPPAPVLPPPATPAPSGATSSAPPLQAIPPTPPVPSFGARAVPRPAAKPVEAEAPSAPPPVVAEAGPPAVNEVFEIIRPMRIIEIGTSPPPPETPPPPPPSAEAKRVSRPPLAASPEIEAFVASPPPQTPKPAKPPVVEEVDAVIDDEPHDTTPRAARTDELEPITDEEIVADRVSEHDIDFATTGEMLAVEVETDDAPKPKKPPPPPPKRQPSLEPAPLASPPPPSVKAAEIPSDAPPVSAPKPPPPTAAAPPPPPQTLDLNKKRQKPWWEEIFSDDYLRTMEKVEPKATKKECDFIEDRLGLEKGAVMLDLACGGGSHAVELASRGYNVVGYDLSLAMLARAQDEAQERGQKINFLQGDMREMAFEEAFDGIYSWSTSFGYFDDEKNLNVLSRIRRGLRQGGLFLLDVINRDYVCPRQPSLVWFEGDGCVCMDEMYVDFFTSRLRVKRTVMFEDGRARECDYSIRLYALSELGKMMHDTGFKVVEVTGHPAHPGVFFGSESPRIIVLAERA